jgi:hypothetical protein
MDLISIVAQLTLVLLGIFIGYLLCTRKQRRVKSEKESINRKYVIHSLLSELSMNHSKLSEGLNYVKNLEGKEVEWFTQSLYFDVYQSLKTSGKYILLSPDTQKALSVYYERLEIIDEARSKPTATLIPKIYKETIDSIKTLVESLKKGYPLIVKALEQEISHD